MLLFYNKITKSYIIAKMLEEILIIQLDENSQEINEKSILRPKSYETF